MCIALVELAIRQIVWFVLAQDLYPPPLALYSLANSCAFLADHSPGSPPEVPALILLNSVLRIVGFVYTPAELTEDLVLVAIFTARFEQYLDKNTKRFKETKCLIY